MPPTDDIFALFQSDPAAEQQGVWVAVAGSEFRIRSMDAPDVQKVRTAQMMRQARLSQANGGLLPQATVTANEVELALAVVTGWQNVPHYDQARRSAGEMLEFTPQNAKALLGNPAMHRLREYLLAQAQTFDNFRTEQVAAIEGNSLPSSGGSSNEAG